MDFLERDELTGLPVAALENLRSNKTLASWLRTRWLFWRKLTVAYVPSPSFSSCWKEERWRLPSMVAATVRDVNSVRSLGCRQGRGREVCFGSNSMLPEVTMLGNRDRDRDR